jgi:drug/metabolite transporter (DMT)-like permease
MKKQPLLIALCYLTLFIVWGSTYFFIKMSVESIPPFYVIGLRFLGGSVLLWALSRTSRQRAGRPTRRQILSSLLLGTLLLIGGNGLITIAEQQVDSYITALIIAATPMVVAAFDRLLLGIRIAPIRLLGIGIGFVGVALLLYTGDSLAASLTPGILLVIGGVGFWGFATSLGHRLETPPNPLVNSSVQMIFVSAVCLTGASVAYPPLPQVLAHASLRSLLGLLFLAVVGSLAYGAYTYLIAHEPAIRVSSYSLVNPVIATLLGLFVGNETPVPLLAAGLPLVLVGVALMLYGEAVVGQIRAGRKSEV